MRELRPFQQEAMQAVLKSFDAGNDRVLISLPTGVGKGTCGAWLVAMWPDLCESYNRPERCLWLAHRDELVWQGADDINEMCGYPPAVEKGEQTIFKDAKLYDRRVVVSSVQTLLRENRREKFGPDQFGLVVQDEAHHAVAESFTKVLDYFGAAKLLGMSVGGDSRVLVRGFNNEIRLMQMEELWNSFYREGPGVMQMEGVSVRAFDGTIFTWKPLKEMSCHHVGDKATFRIRTKHGRSILVTEDHSLYRVRDNTLELCLGSDIQVGDKLLLEDVIQAPDHAEQYASIIDAQWMDYAAYGDFADVIEEHITGDNGYKEAWKRRWERLRGKYGPYLRRDEYLAWGGKQHVTLGLAGRSNTCHSHIPVADLAWLLGFYVGDGWSSRGRVGFAVELGLESRVRDYLSKLSPYVSSKVTTTERPGKSVEICMCNQFLAAWFHVQCGTTADTKHVPDCVWNWSNADVRQFIDGLIASDGHVSNKSRNRSRCYIVTVSRDLAEGLVILLSRLRVTASIHSQPPGKGGIINGRQIVGRHTRYSIHFSMHSYNGNEEGHHGKQVRRLPSMSGIPVTVTSTEEEAATYVYDLSIDDNKWQTFVASGILVHNTATCDRTDEISLGRMFQDVAHHYELLDAINDGWLSPIDQQFLTVEGIDFSKVGKDANGDISATDMGRIYREEDVLHRVIAPTVEYAEDRQTILFAPTVASAEAFAVMLERYGKTAIAVSGRTPDEERREAVERYKSGEYQYLVNCALYLEGFNAPATSCIVIARSTNSRMLYAQMLGRGMRGGPKCPIPGKTNLLVLDLVGASLKHKLVHAADLLGGKYDEVVVMAANEAVQKKSDEGVSADVMAELLAAAAKADELKAAQRRKILAEAKVKAKTVDPFLVFSDIPTRHIPEWWTDTPATAEQCEHLESQGIRVEGRFSFAEARQLQQEVWRRQRDNLCSYKQARQLNARGYDPCMSRQQAIKVLEYIAKRPGGFAFLPEDGRRKAIRKKKLVAEAEALEHNQ